MSLIKSISGIRGTIGGQAGDTLNPLDIVKFTSAYATFIRQSTPNGSGRIVVGRDARISGELVRSIVCGTLLGMGYDVIDIGLATTPTTELAVTMAEADGGISILDDSLGIDWKIPTDHSLLSDKDTKHSLLKDFDSPFDINVNLY